MEFAIGSEVEVILTDEKRSIGKYWVIDWNKTLGPLGNEKLGLAKVATILEEEKMREFKIDDEVDTPSGKGIIKRIEPDHAHPYYVQCVSKMGCYVADQLKLSYKTLAELMGESDKAPFKVINKDGNSIVWVIGMSLDGLNAVVSFYNKDYREYSATNPIWQLYQEPEEEKPAEKCEHETVKAIPSNQYKCVKCDTELELFEVGE